MSSGSSTQIRLVDNPDHRFSGEQGSHPRGKCILLIDRRGEEQDYIRLHGCHDEGAVKLFLLDIFARGIHDIIPDDLNRLGLFVEACSPMSLWLSVVIPQPIFPPS